MCDDSFKIIMDSFIQNGLNMMVLYVGSRPTHLFVPTYGRIDIRASQFIVPSRLVSRGQNTLGWSDDLL